MARYENNTVRSVHQINAELEKIKLSIQTLLDREGSQPNQMEAELDMNSNRILNTPSPLNQNDVVNKQYVDQILVDQGAQAVTPVDLARITADGVNTVYTVPNVNDSPSRSYLVFIDGVHQKPEVDYMVTGTELVMSSPAPSGAFVDITYYEPQVVNRITNNVKYYSSLQVAIEDTSLTEGESVVTTGYYEANDGGGATYNVVPKLTGTADGGSYIDALNGSVQLELVSSANQIVFGVRGTGYPVDDGQQLNKYAEYCRSTGSTLRLVAPAPQLIYTTETIDFKGVHVEGDFPATINFGPTPSNMNFVALTGIPSPRPSVSDVYTDPERLPTEGVCIFSDVATTVVEVSAEYVLKGFGVSGWLASTGQVCIRDPLTGSYRGVTFDWEDVWVTGSGGDGIALENGIEVCTWKNVKSNYNNGYGVTTAGGGGDDNQEYFECYNCEFRVNRLDGFLMANFRKGVKFEFCNGNSNGWYGLGASAVTKPIDERFIRGLVRIQGVQTFGAANLKIKDCYSEDCARLATFELNNPLKGLEITGNYSIPTLGLSDINNDMFYFYDDGTSQLRNLVIKNNNIQDSSRGKIFNGDVTESDFVDAEIGYIQTTDYDLSKINHVVQQSKKYEQEQEFLNHIKVPFENIGDGSAGTFTSNYILDNIRDIGQGNNSHARGTCYLLTSNWQATNANNGGAYLVWAYRSASGLVLGNVLAFGSTQGFTSAPSVGSDGVLSVQLDSFYRAQITRIDLNGYKA